MAVFSRMREIGGRIVRLTDSSVAMRFGFGVCGSISETVSTAALVGVSGAIGAGFGGCFFAAIGAKADLVGVTAGLAGRHLGLFGPIGRCLLVDFGSDPFVFGCLGCSSGLDRSAGASRRRLGGSGGLRRLAAAPWAPIWSSFSLAFEFFKNLLMAVSGQARPLLGRNRFTMHRLVNFARLFFVHAENIDKILTSPHRASLRDW